MYLYPIRVQDFNVTSLDKWLIIFLQNAVDGMVDTTTAAIDRIGNAFTNIDLIAKPIVIDNTTLSFDQNTQQHILHWMTQLDHQPAKREYGKLLNILLYGNK